MKPHNPQQEALERSQTTDSIVATMIATNPVYMAQTALAFTATSSPVPTVTATPGSYGITTYPLPDFGSPVSSDLLMFKLSFYDPNIGSFFQSDPELERAYSEVNCASYDYELHMCVSAMSNGDPFERWYGRGVACPPPLQLGDIIRVVYPEQLAQDWTCVDRGGAIVDGYLDFLLRYPSQVWTGYNLNNFPWASTVQAYHIHP